MKEIRTRPTTEFTHHPKPPNPVIQSPRAEGDRREGSEHQSPQSTPEPKPTICLPEPANAVRGAKDLYTNALNQLQNQTPQPTPPNPAPQTTQPPRPEAQTEQRE